jgi:hypothetical protein
MSDQALVFHLNRYGMVLHMESFGNQKPFKPTPDCLGRTFSEIMPGDIGERVIHTLELAIDHGPGKSAFAFGYELEGKPFAARVTYLNKTTALVVVQPA